MDETITARIPMVMLEQLGRADLENRSAVIRDALKDELIKSTVGICAITGKRCYENMSVEVKADSPMAEYINLPDELDAITIEDTEFTKLSRNHAQGEKPETSIDDSYLHQVGAARYHAENSYMRDATPRREGLFNHSWAYVPLADRLPEEQENENRLMCLLEWCYGHGGTPEPADLQSIWNSFDELTQRNVIKRAECNQKSPLADALDELGIKCP